MQKSSLHWVFNRAFVYSKERIYLLADLPELQDQQMNVTQVIRKTSTWDSFRIDWAVMHLCVTDFPELTLLCIDFYGRVFLATSSGFSEEEIDLSDEGPANRGDLRDIRLIGEKVFVAGMGRQVYRRDQPGVWKRIDQDILVPAKESRIVGFNSIDGFNENDLYAVGWAGEIWHYDGQKWYEILSPTNLKLERVVCVAPDMVYACGQCGIILRYSKGQIEVIEHGVTNNQFWGMEWFNNTLWIATHDAVYKLTSNDNLIKINFGLDDQTATCGWLHSCSNLMWSVGGNHLLSTSDGVSWQLEVVP